CPALFTRPGLLWNGGPACRGIPARHHVESWPDMLWNLHESILRRHTYERAQPGSRLYRLCGLQVFAQSLGNRLPMGEAGELGFATTRTLQLAVPGSGKLRAPQLCGSGTRVNAEPLGLGRGGVNIQLQPHRHGSVCEVCAGCESGAD